jgi:hypothetical protein
MRLLLAPNFSRSRLGKRSLFVLEDADEFGVPHGDTCLSDDQRIQLFNG